MLLAVPQHPALCSIHLTLPDVVHVEASWGGPGVCDHKRLSRVLPLQQHSAMLVNCGKLLRSRDSKRVFSGEPCFFATVQLLYGRLGSAQSAHQLRQTGPRARVFCLCVYQIATVCCGSTALLMVGMM